MDGWEIALWVVAGYVAVMVLVRFMSARRLEVLRELRERAEAQPRSAQPRSAQPRPAQPRPIVNQAAPPAE
ncbi:MAG TPA: hypothetical protein VF306_14145 [Pirellulales bacterium]